MPRAEAVVPPPPRDTSPAAGAASTLKVGAKRLAKRLLRPLIYRYPPIGLQPERLELWLRTLIETRGVDGDVVEVGCSLGGTAAFSWRMLRNLGVARRYVCIDTFAGFVPAQFDDDLGRGNREANRWLFADNSRALVRAVLDQHGAHGVELVPGDIVTLDESALPARIAAALLDVDLALPIHAALAKLHPRLAPGGVIVVDDCPERYDWQARQGYERYCREAGLAPRYELGAGLVRRER
jgi:predicted O-methyltransferase YrrM